MDARTLFMVLLFVGSVFAQKDTGLPGVNNRVSVHISFDNGGCDSSTQVALMHSGVAAVARSSTNKSCYVEFSGVPAGTYHLMVSGQGFENVDGGEITVGGIFDSGTAEITVQHPKSEAGFTSDAASVSVNNLRVPRKAALEFDKAGQHMKKQEWKAAIDDLQMAIAIYPPYASAYNSLGVIYARMGDRNKEAEVLRKALSIDDRYIPSYVNLARMDIAVSNFADAELQLEKALTLDPVDNITLTLLAHAEFMNYHLDEAIAHCKQVHAIAKIPHSYVHWIAAFAFEQKNQLADAAAELQTFVNENPRGDRSDDARKEIANIASFLSGKQ